MNDIEELKQFAHIHARAQGLRDYAALVGRVRTDEPDGPGSWAFEWFQEGRRLEEQGDLLGACRAYTMARFPYVDGPVREHAQLRCAETFENWTLKQRAPIERLDLTLPGGRVRCWTHGLTPGGRLPLLLVMGGIVSVKEQWAQNLVALRRLGFAAVAAEMPGVGENTLRYDEHSVAMIPAILDALEGRADVGRSYAMAASFSGHLALRCAVSDPRIRGVVTIGAPVSAFFTDQQWQRRLPRVTADTLAHLTGLDFPQLSRRLPAWAMTGPQLEALRIPVAYLASERDEIIPPQETQLLRAHVSRLSLAVNDDVHASPGHVTETRLWSALSLLRMSGTGGAQRAVLAMSWRLAHAAGRHRKPPPAAQHESRNPQKAAPAQDVVRTGEGNRP